MERAFASAPQFPSLAFSTGGRRLPPTHLRFRAPNPLVPSNLRIQDSRGFQQDLSLRTRSTSENNTPGPGSGENDSKAVLEAFFLGKAFAEALNERIGSTVGEILSIIGQWQAEQQKQVLDFQEEVMQRATKAKGKAALEALEGQGALWKPSSTPLKPSVPAPTPPSSGLTTDDPLEEMLKG